MKYYKFTILHLRFARLCVRTILPKRKNNPKDVSDKRANVMAGKKVFVTVGTTHFNALIEVMSKEETLKILHSKGYTSLVLQIGQGDFVPPTQKCHGVTLSFFRLKPSIAEDFATADLVISHAGAGSCLEALEAGKPLIAVVNNTLMENHQSELAEELSKSELCFCCYPSTIQETLANLDLSRLKAYEPGQPKLVAKYLDSVIRVF